MSRPERCERMPQYAPHGEVVPITPTTKAQTVCTIVAVSKETVLRVEAGE